jgi:TP901 family phage tail tape measure protein
VPNYDLGTARGRIIIDSSTIGRSTAALDKLSKGMLAVGLLGAVGFGYAIKAAADFEEQLSRFKAVTNTPQKAMDQLSAKALQLGRDSAFGATEVIKAFVELGKSGATATDILNGLGDATVYLAAAGELPLADASIILVNALKQFHLPAQQAVHVADLLAGAANASTSEVDDLAASLRYAGPVAAFAGVSIEDTATTLALFANAGIKGSAAGTAMRAMLLGIAGTTPKAENTLRSLGIITEDGTNRFYDMNGALKPLPEVFQILGDSLKGLNPHEKTVALNAIFLRRGLVAAAIAATEGADGFGKMRKEVEKTTAQDVMKEKLDNLKGSLKILGASLETFAITIGQQFTPGLKKAADFLRDLTNTLAKMSPEQKKVLTYVLLGITGFMLFGGALGFTLSRLIKAYRAFRDLGVALKIAGGLLGKMTGLSALGKFAWGKLVSGLESLALAFMDTAVGAALMEAPLLLIVITIALVAAAAYFLWTNWDKVWNWIKDHPAYAILISILAAPIAAFVLLIGGLKWLWDNWHTIWDWIKQAASDAVDWIVNAWDDLQSGFDDVVNWIDQAVHDVINFFKKLPGRIATFMGQAVDTVLQFIRDLPGRILQLVQDAGNWLVDTGPEILRGLAYGLGLGLGLIIGFFIGLPILIANLLVSAGSWLIAQGTATLQGFYNGLLSFIGTVFDFFVQLPGWILGIVSAAAVWLFNTGRDVVIGFLNGLISFLGNALNFFYELPGKILGAVSDAGNWLVNTGVQVIAGFASGLPGRFASVLSWFQGLPGSIIGALGDAGSWLVGVGGKIIDGLLDGIKDGVGAVKDFLGSLGDLIPDWKGPPEYDAKLLIGNGQLIMNGLKKGLESGWPQIQSLLEDYTAMIGSPISGSVAYSAAASGGRVWGNGSDAPAMSTRPVRVVEQHVVIQALDARQAAIAVERERVWAERTAGDV